MIIGKLGLSFVVAGKCETEEDRKHLAEVNEVPPKFGRNWWYWRPRIRFDPFGKQGHVTRFQIKWLCYIYEIEWWN